MLNKIYTALALFALPVFAFAQAPLSKTGNFFESVRVLVSTVLIPTAFTLALLYFFYGVAKYIWAEGQGKDDGKRIMIWGVVALFVMSSIWGIVYFARDELGVNYDSTMPIPTIE